MLRELVGWVRRFAASRLGTLCKVLFSLGLLAWFAANVDVERLRSLFAAVRWTYLIPLIFLSLSRIWVSAVRFRVLAKPFEALRLRTLTEQYFVSSYFNNLLPTSLGGDFVRLFMLSDVGLPKRKGAVLILVERFTGSLALVTLATIGVFAYPVPSQLRTVVFVLALGSGAVVGVFSIVPSLLPRLLGRFGTGLSGSSQAIEVLAARPGRLLGVFGLSLLLQVASIAVSWVVALALGVDVTLLACLAVVPLVWLVTLLPVSIGGIGLREASFAYFMGMIGIPTEASLLISLGTFASLLFNGAIGGLLLATRSLQSSVEKAREMRLNPDETIADGDE